MQDFKTVVRSLQKDNMLKESIDAKLSYFSSYLSDEQWFSELCFCLLTANAKSQTACDIQEFLGYDGFVTLSEDALARVILSHKHRFYRVKAGYIVEARKYHRNIKKEIESMLAQGMHIVEVRDSLALSVKGFGYKEASHFLRNVGFFDLAILDRHILGLMVEYGYISEKPKTLTKHVYHKVEKVFEKMAQQVGMKPGELDYYMFYVKTGKVLK